MGNPEFFKQLNDFPSSCMFALVDEQLKGMYIQFSRNNALHELVQTITQLKRGIHDCNKLQDTYNRGVLELHILKVYDNPPTPAIIRAEAFELLKEMGYSDMRDNYVPSSYRLKRYILQDRAGKPHVYISARCNAQKELLLGIFDSIAEADEWIELTYPGQRDGVIVPRFALNERTREYHEAYGYKLMRRKLK